MKIFKLSTLLLVFITIQSFGLNGRFTNLPNELDLQLLSKPELLRQPERRGAPDTPVRAIAEFETMEGVVVSYRNSMDEKSEFGIPLELIKDLAEITTVYCLVNEGDQSSAEGEMSGASVNMNNVEFVVGAVNSYWTRDYAPWWIATNGKIEIIDFHYNRPSRPDDNKIPGLLGRYFNVNAYYMDMIHCGGNFMTDGYGNGFSTKLVWTENSDYTMVEIDNLVREYLGINRYVITDDPLQAYIQHIDCWGKLLAPDKILITDVPESNPNKNLYDEVTEYYANLKTAYGTPFKIYRVYSEGEPYTNSLIVNKNVYVPLKGTSNDENALKAYRDAMPGYTVKGYLNTGNAWESTDALHCRVKGIADRELLYLKHYPLHDTVISNVNEGFKIDCNIKSYGNNNLIDDSLLVFYKYSKKDDYQVASIGNTVNDQFSGYIPFSSNQSETDSVFYYLFAKDESGRREMHPYIGAEDPYVFVGKKGSTDINNFINESYSFKLNVYKRLLTIDNVKSINIFDLRGRKMIGISYNDNKLLRHINIENFKSGKYVLSIVNNAGNKFQKGILISH